MISTPAIDAKLAPSPAAVLVEDHAANSTADARAVAGVEAGVEAGAEADAEAEATAQAALNAFGRQLSAVCWSAHTFLP